MSVNYDRLSRAGMNRGDMKPLSIKNTAAKPARASNRQSDKSTTVEPSIWAQVSKRMTEKQKKSILKKIQTFASFQKLAATAGIAGVVLAAGVFLLMPFSQQKSIDVQKIKESLVFELQQEVREILRTEIENYSPKTDVIRDVEQALGVSPSPSEVRTLAEVLDQQSGMRQLTNQELGLYVAGAGRNVPADQRPSEGSIQMADGFSSQTQSSVGPSDSKQSQSIPAPSSDNRPREKAMERTLVQEGGMLLSRGTFQAEPSFTAAHFSSNRINIEGFNILPVLVIGEISTESVKRDILFSSLGLKYGLWHNLQVEVKAPYRYEIDRVTSNLGVETTRDVKGIGDAEGAVSVQILQGHSWLPDTIVSVGLKAPTGADPYTNVIGLGTGHWGGRVSLVGVKSSDPAVIFGTLSYTYNAPRAYDLYGNVDPGDSIGYGLGTAIALSYQTAINFQFEHSLGAKTKRDGIELNGTYANNASLKTGFTWTISEKLGVDVGLSMGLTTDAPDYVFDFRLPYTF